MNPTGRETQTSLKWLMQVLKGVSRSFYLSVRILRRPLRKPIGVAYLLARASDTIADTPVLDWRERLQLLEDFQVVVAGGIVSGFDGSSGRLGLEDPGEITLMKHLPEILEYFQAMDGEERREIVSVIDTIVSGQSLDIRRFDSQDHIVALKNAGELDDYTYRVAGVVGEFWTRISHLKGMFSDKNVFDRALICGVRLGKGLQLVNILRDLPGDLARNRCYLPQDALESVGLSPADLIQKELEPRFRPVYRKWLEMARDHLRAGWEYVLMVPPREKLMRLACAWPVLIGFATIQKLEGANPLDAGKVKVPRKWIYRMIRLSLVTMIFPKAIENLPARVLGKELAEQCLTRPQS